MRARRWLVVLVAVLVVGSGCERPSEPAPPTATPSSTVVATPALSLETAQPVVDQLYAVMIRADRRQSVTLAATVLTGGALTRARGYYALTTRTGRRRTWEPSKVRAQTVISSSSLSYPQTAWVLSRFSSGGQKRRTHRMLYDLTRTSARDAWLLRGRMIIAAKKVEPLIATIDPLSAPVEQVRRTNGIRLDEVSSTLARALNRPGGRDATRFTRDPYRDFFRDEMTHSTHERVEFIFAPSDPSVGWRTRSGGVLALVPGRWTVDDTMLDDWYIYFDRSMPEHKKLRHHYESQRTDYLTLSLVRLPARGRLKLVDCTAATSSVTLQRTRD